MHRLILIFCLLELLPGILPAQSYSAVQYNINDGLAAATVYNMIQDKNGFIWFGTEAGLCRFDGTHFKTFTTADGLPDNEILKMYQDAAGRIWMLPFKNAICYYLDGKIYNQQNDSVLKKINIRERLLNIFEDAAGTIWANEQGAIYRIYKNNTVERLESLGGVKLHTAYYFGNDNHDRVWFLTVTNGKWVIYKYENGRSLPCKDNYPLAGINDFQSSPTARVWRQTAKTFFVESDKYPPTKILPWYSKQYQNTFSFINDSIISLNTINGARLFNIKTGRSGPLLLEGKSTSCVIQDREQNWWVSTLGEGVFRMPSENFRRLDIPGMHTSSGGIAHFLRLDTVLYIFGPNASLVRFRLPYLNIIDIKTLSNQTNRIFDLFRRNNKYLLLSGNGFFQYDASFKFLGEYQPGIFTKDLIRNDSMLLIASNVNVVRFDIDKFRITDTLFEGRSTAIHVQGATTYVGTLHGLYAVTGHRPPVYLGLLDTAFKNRIATLNESRDGSLWVGTTDQGLIQFKNGHVVYRYNTTNGLSSNICRTVLMDSNILWLGTNKGLNKINIQDTPGKIIKITHSDGLSSDEVNKLLAYGDTLFAGTSEGINYFNKTKLGQPSECTLNILDVAGITTNLSGNRVYKIDNKTLRISYVAISFKSAGDIVYRYRLTGVDTGWKTTRSTSLEFVALPYGHYDLELVAENKFGVQSNTVAIELEVPIPFRKTPAFYISSAVLFGSFLFALYKKRLSIIRRREKEKTILNKKLAEMEMRALRAQMNPHFTFNVLNSIQYYIGYNNTTAAQNYLAKFSKLIRLTLDNSKHTFITLEEEQRILKLYLDLERMRFDDKFAYEITIDDCINQAILIPNMLIQPFVENAIKHGFKESIRHPKVDIRIKDQGNSIHCTITDNGTGRRSSEKPVVVNDHQPAGVAMVMDKAEVLRHYYNYNVSIDVSDLHFHENEARGTRVFITIPKLTVIP